MRIPGTFRALFAVLTLAVAAQLGMPGAARASGGVTAEELRATAESAYDMSCNPLVDGWRCDAWPLLVIFTPATGEVTYLRTSSDEASFDGMSAQGQAMMREFLGVTCQDAASTDAYVAAVAALTSEGSLDPVSLARCDLAGRLMVDCELDCYQIEAVVHDPPTASPTPSATPTPTPVPTAPVTASPTPRPTVRPTVGSSAAASATPSIRPSPAATRDAPASATPQSASGTPSPTSEPHSASGTPSPTPEQQVAGDNPTPSPAGGPEAPAQAPDPAQPSPTFARSVAGLSAISTDAGAVAQSAALALLFLLFMAFAGELFNSTLEGNYDEVAGWFAGFGSRIAGIGRVWRGPAGVVVFIGLGALVYALLDPGFTLDLGALATYLGLLVGLVLVLVSFELPPLLLYRRRTGELPGLRALPWTLPAAAVCVLLSRVAELQPGYLYGILLGLVFRRELSAADEGRQAAAGALWTLIVAVAAWLALDWLQSGAAAPGGFGSVLLETALAVVVVGGLEAVALGLLPMRFLAGASIYAWSRAAWAILLGAGLFAFFHLLVGPHTGYLAELDPGRLAAACGAFAAFGAGSVLFWSYFRFRPARHPA